MRKPMQILAAALSALAMGQTTPGYLDLGPAFGVMEVDANTFAVATQPKANSVQLRNATGSITGTRSSDDEAFILGVTESSFPVVAKPTWAGSTLDVLAYTEFAGEPPSPRTPWPATTMRCWFSHRVFVWYTPGCLLLQKVADRQGQQNFPPVTVPGVPETSRFCVSPDGGFAYILGSDRAPALLQEVALPLGRRVKGHLAVTDTGKPLDLPPLPSIVCPVRGKVITFCVTDGFLGERPGRETTGLCEVDVATGRAHLFARFYPPPRFEGGGALPHDERRLQLAAIPAAGKCAVVVSDRLYIVGYAAGAPAEIHVSEN